MFEYIKSVLKPFFCSKVTIAEAVIAALLNLATYDKPANSCSLPEKLDCAVK